MPGLKRSREILADDDEEEDDLVEEVDSARSEFRQDNRKRSRVSDPEEISEEDSDDETSEVDSDDEVTNLQASQFQEKQKRKAKKKNLPADNGVVEKVTVRNFMCHTFLEVDIGPLINFIIGHNGSGKSAVLTAITICLGGKASSTNRGGSLKAFIKEGQESCTLTVRLKNCGDTGYQQDVYGNAIIVERHFTKTGSSSFKLKSATGRTISTRKGDLDDISDYYSLQMDNPMTILSQDNARQFLNNSTASEKYRFFIKGVQLEQLSQDYQLLEENIDFIEGTFPEKMEGVKKLKEEMERAQQLLALSEKHDGMRAKIKRLFLQMAWVQVVEQERLRDKHEKEISTVDEKIAHLEQKVHHCSEQFQEAHEALDRALTDVTTFKEECEPIIAEEEAAKENYGDSKKEATALHTEQRKIQETLRNEKKRIFDFEKEIEAELKRLEEANGGSHAKRYAELDARKAAVDELKARLEEHDLGLPSLRENEKQATQIYENLKTQRSARNDQLQRCEEQLTALNQDRGQRLAGFPQNMGQLINAIKQDNGFQQRPLGPIGNHIRLTKPAWSSLLERSFGGSLNGFIVTSKADQSRLSEIMRRVRCNNCPIFIGNNNAFDYSSNEPDPDLLTALRALEIDNPIITRQLIILQGIEQTVLIEDGDEARNLMDRTRLRNVKQVFSLNQRGGQRLTYGYQGYLNSTFVDGSRGPPRMKTDSEVQIRLQMEEVERARRARNEADQRFQDAQKAINEAKQAFVRHDRRSKELKVEIRAAQSTVNDLQDALDRDSVEEGKLDQLKANLEEAKSDHSITSGSYQEAVIAMDKYKADMANLLGELKNIGQRKEIAQARVAKADKIVIRLTNQRQAALQDKNSVYEALDIAKDEKLQAEEARDKATKTIAEWSEKAAECGPRVPIDPMDTSVTLQTKYEKLSKDLRNYETKMGGNKTKITEDLAAATEAYNSAFFRQTEEEKLAQLLKSSLMYRRERWRLFKKFITARARMMFQYLMSIRAFRGKLLVDHHSRAMELKVEPDETQMGQGRQTKTLSGGEKSFSTICLLLALWEAMGAPVRCLDEFDVYMDSVNREISMNMLIEAARGAAGRQFVFITPQSMGNIKDSSLDVKIIRMRDPERNQTTIELPRN